MEKLNMQTPNLVDKNVEQIARLFPEVITEIKDKEGNLIKGIDFDLLKQKLSSVLVEDENERYRLDWPGKKASLLKANTPITKTLRPVVEESVNFDRTENLYIEGDNFEALKILQESYLGIVKMIFIDPPYNRGSDLIYKDDFRVSTEEYEEEIGALDEKGIKMFKNTDSNGRFHSDWLCIMYERLIIARDLLSESGFIFVSIDENEVHNLRKICDDIYGEENFVTYFLWKKKSTTSNVKDSEVSSQIDFQLCYKKSSEAKIKQRVKLSETRNYPNKDTLGSYRTAVIEKKDSGGYKRDTMKFDILGHPPREGKRWQIGEVTAREYERNDRFIWDGEKIVLKIYDFEDTDTYSAQPNLLDNLGSSDSAAKMVNQDIFGIEELFDNPKPIELIKYFIEISSNKDSIILDFFSGSATTAHSVMQINAEDGGNRKFIMVQLPEKTDDKSEAFKAGYKTIADIGKERIRRAGKKIKEEFLNKYTEELEKINKKLSQGSLLENEELKEQKSELESKIEHIKSLDIGFRVYKTDSSNMKDVFYHPAEVKQEQLSAFESNIKEDRTPEDLLTQVMLGLGLELSLSIDKREILGNNVFVVQENALIACFDDNINFGIVDVIADLKPFKVVLKDAGFADDKDRINVEERFKRLSPETVITVI